MIYAAQFDQMNALIGYLTENCCQGRADECVSAVRKTDVRAARKKETV
jgi:hypothetical protein